MQRTAIHTIGFVAFCDSGLHIGGSQDELTIGGADNPCDQEPGNTPTLHSRIVTQGKDARRIGEADWVVSGGRREDEPCGCDDCAVCRVFGAHKNSAKSRLGPSRIIVRDGRLRKGGHIENKTENVINRQTGAAHHPRTNERVVEGTEFRMQLVLQVFDLDEQFSHADRNGNAHQGDEALQAVVADGLWFVQMTGLGGGTSRGSGAVRFEDFEMDGRPWIHWSA